MRTILTEAADLGVSYLTAYAFSTENWRRPSEEVSFLMELFSSYIDTEVEALVNKNVRLHFIGSRERLNPELCKRMAESEERTAFNTGITLNLAVDYGGRAEIVEAVRKIAFDLKTGGGSPDSLMKNCFPNICLPRVNRTRIF